MKEYEEIKNKLRNGQITKKQYEKFLKDMIGILRKNTLLIDIIENLKINTYRNKTSCYTLNIYFNILRK